MKLHCHEKVSLRDKNYSVSWNCTRDSMPTMLTFG